MISAVLVAVQFICLAIFVITGPVIVRSSLIGAEALSFVIAIWAIYTMRQSRLNVFPDLLDGSSLVTTGLYKYIRHPMYLSLIILSLTLLMDSYSLPRLIATLLLLIDLLLKIEWEERILIRELPGYSRYREKTRKLIPFLY